MTQSKENELTKEEMHALTKDLQEVLAKHGAEMGIVSTINITKVPTALPYANETDAEQEVSKEENDEAKPKTNEGGEKSPGEPTQS